MKKEVERKAEEARKGQQYTSETGTREPLACPGVRKPGSEGLSATQREAGKEKEAGAIAGKGIGLTFPCRPSRGTGAIGHAGCERGKEEGQEGQEEDAAEEEQPVVVSEEVEEDDDDKE